MTFVSLFLPLTSKQLTLYLTDLRNTYVTLSQNTLR